MLAVVLALKLPTILILVWAFSRPEESFRPGRRYWAVVAITVVHVLLALLSLTGEKSSLSEMFVAFPLIWSVLFRDRIRGVLSRPVSVWWMATAICLLLWFEETWVIVDQGSPPWRHYVHYFGFYFGMTATILGLFLVIAVLPLVTWLLWSAILQAFGFDRTGVP